MPQNDPTGRISGMFFPSTNPSNGSLTAQEVIRRCMTIGSQEVRRVPVKDGVGDALLRALTKNGASIPDYVYPVNEKPDAMIVRDGARVIYDPNRPRTAAEEQETIDLLKRVRDELRKRPS